MLGFFWGDGSGRGMERGRRGEGRRGPAKARRRGHRPNLEGLEARIALATDTWTGLGANTNWTTPDNWSGDVAPSAGDDLVFPTVTLGLTNTNNFPSGTVFNSITIGGSGYDLGGNAIDLNTGITATYTTGSSTDAIDTTLTESSTPVSVASGGTLVLPGVLSGTAGLLVSGGGTLQLGGVNKYTGTTTISTGTTVQVNGTIADVQDNGGVLGGNGTVGAVTSIGGTINPGDNAPGVLTAGGAVSLDGASTYSVDLDGTSPGNGTTGYDQLVTSGTGATVTLGGATLSATLGPAYSSPAVGDQLTIISNGSGSAVSGIFAGLAEGAAVTVSGSLFRISYLGKTGSSHDVVLSAVANTSTTTLSPIIGPVTYGQPVTLTATVTGSGTTPPTATGTVEFFDGSPIGGGTEVASAAVNGGIASTTVSNLSVTGSPHEIYALYVPSPTVFTYAGSTSAPESVTINPATLTVTGVTAENKVYDGTTTAAIDVSGATLNGVLNHDVVNLNTTGYSANFSTPNAGTNIPVTVTGLSLTGTASSNYVLTQPTGLTADITPAPLTLTANNQTMNYGGTVPTLTYTATGFVGTDTTSVLTTQPTLTTTATSSSPPGTYPIDITGGTAANYTITDVPGTLTVVISTGTTTTLSSSSQVAVTGQPVTFTATVTPTSPGVGTPTGTVFFIADSSVLLGESSLDTTGTATLTTSSLSFGLHSIVAEYLSNSSFQDSTSSAIEEFITRAGTQPVLTVQPVRNRHGKIFAVDLVTQVDVVSPGGGVPTGTVTYFINGRASYQTVPVTNGTAVLAMSPQRLTNKIVFARYIGDVNYIASVSSSQLISRRSLLSTSKAQKRVEVRHHGR